MRELRVGRSSRDRYGLDARHLGPDGELVVAKLAAARRLAARLNERASAGAPSASAGEIVALGLLHEIGHALIDRYEADVRPGVFASALEELDELIGRKAVDDVLTRLAAEFGAEPDRPDLLESLVLLDVAATNPASAPLHPLVDPGPVARARAYDRLTKSIDGVFGENAEGATDGESVLDLLRAPARHSPTSLAGQLRYARERWAAILPADLAARLVAGEDLLAEEDRGLHLRFGGGGGPHVAEAPSFAGADVEPERFSTDRDWMPRIVLAAKSTYVWLDQLSRTYGREIHTLDAVPDEELDTLARRGITGLWLIGLWQRSPASERIKRWRGNADAVASAYSLDDYRIADDLGGDAAHATLRDRAAARGIRLASDMVPNHMGIDSRWVIDHPERFLSVAEPPFPAYTFSGANLSDDHRVEIRLEDHYWNDSDAAVVFERRDTWSGDVRYVYHGNDGTSFPWNDTAQLDYLRADVREAVIQTILEVARRFPVIRFDAAMVLAKRHIQRLWWPQPGQGGGIPSRSEHAKAAEAFDAAMPNEFWREVVDRVAAEAPETLLLAEAFWLMEGYFVRTLGMHRVYNSAFMHMLRDEDNAGYRKVIRDTLEFDPEILKRYVNFMTNPDEETAIEQFSTGDKAFGVATLLATLPGLPMIGHGQVEGFSEKYGMEFRRARLDEAQNQGHVERFEREIAPLLHQRRRYAEAADFLLYDVTGEGGAVAEDVYAYSNGRGPDRSLVVYHNRYASASGWIRDSVPYARKGPDGSKTLVRRTLGEALELAPDDGRFVAFRDARSGLEFLRSARELVERGLFVELDAYRCLVFGEFREVNDAPDAPWAELAAALAGRGVPSVEEALADHRLAPLHALVEALLEEGIDAAEAARRRDAVLAAAGVAVPKPATAGRATVPPADVDPAARAAVLLAGLDRTHFDDFRFWVPLRAAGLDDWQIMRTRVALGLRRASAEPDPAALAEAWLSDPEVRVFVGVNEWENTEWFGKDAFDSLLDLARDLELATGSRRAPAVIGKVRAATKGSGYRVDTLLANLRGTGPTTARAKAKPAAPKPAAPKPAAPKSGVVPATRRSPRSSPSRRRSS
ncbi:MAG TPA: alpha-amylase family glycosyl hydrolase [Candidatus Limnocylindrales bacterium]|nr:alpha-amylase family glycosyl hydrolase [Candidatus Limnocylindrales bacterium]